MAMASRHTHTQTDARTCAHTKAFGFDEFHTWQTAWGVLPSVIVRIDTNAIWLKKGKGEEWHYCQCPAETQYVQHSATGDMRFLWQADNIWYIVLCRAEGYYSTLCAESYDCSGDGNIGPIFLHSWKVDFGDFTAVRPPSCNAGTLNVRIIKCV